MSQQDPFSKTQMLLLTESMRELKEEQKALDERLREAEGTNRETKVYFKTIMDALQKMQDAAVDVTTAINNKIDEHDEKIEKLELDSSEQKGTWKGLALAGSIGGGVGAFFQKIFTHFGGGSH